MQEGIAKKIRRRRKPLLKNRNVEMDALDRKPIELILIQKNINILKNEKKNQS